MVAKHSLKNEKGFTFVEMVVVLATFSILLGAVISFLLFSLRATSVVTEANIAQSEMRAMMTEIKLNASTAVRAIPCSEGQLATIFAEVDADGNAVWTSDNTWVFKVKNEKLLITGRGGDTDLKEPRFLKPLKGLEVKFTKSEFAGTDVAKQVVTVIMSAAARDDGLGASGLQLYDLEYTDEIYIGNINPADYPDGNPVGTSGGVTFSADGMEYDCLVLMSPPKFGP